MFAERVELFLREAFAESPVWATGLGMPGFEDQLDDLSEAGFESRRRRRDRWLGELGGLEESALAPTEQIDRELILAMLRGSQVMEDWQMWRRQPDTYLNPALNGIFGQLLHRLRPDGEVLRSVTLLLRQIPSCLEHGKVNLDVDLVPRIYLERAVKQAAAGSQYVRVVLPGQLPQQPPPGDLLEAAAAAGDAFEDFGAYLAGLSDTVRGEWAIGETRYTQLLQQRELLASDASRLHARGEAEYARLADELRRCAQRVDGTDEWRRILAELNEDHPKTPAEMRDAYAQATHSARSFLVERQIVTFPEGEECHVDPSPLFQRPVLAVASYLSPPPMAASMLGHFFVPYPPDGASETEIQERLASNSFASMPTTSVHEAYPGHHWHLATVKVRAQPLRRAFRTAYFTEGWGLYAEQLMREQGFFTDVRQEMCQYEATLFRAARVVVDTALHSGEMGFEEAVQFMIERANLPPPTARAEVVRYCAWPTQASAYLTGLLEILRIRDDYLRANLPDGKHHSLRQFHDSLAASGGLPLRLAERALNLAG